MPITTRQTSLGEKPIFIYGGYLKNGGERLISSDIWRAKANVNSDTTPARHTAIRCTCGALENPKAAYLMPNVVSHRDLCMSASSTLDNQNSE